MGSPDCKWVLGYDGDCESCTMIASEVDILSGGRIHVLPIFGEAFQGLLSKSGVENSQWGPILLRVREREAVKAYSGPRLGPALVSAVGPVRAVRILAALPGASGDAGTMRSSVRAPGVSRKNFLSRVAKGSLIAGGVLVASKVPAMAAVKESREAQEWVAANRSALPSTVAEYRALTPAHQLAAYTETTEQLRSQLWVSKIDEYLEMSDGFSPSQFELLRKVREFVAKPEVFSPAISAENDPWSVTIAALDAEMIKQFGKSRSYDMFSKLGDEKRALLASRQGVFRAYSQPWCNCSTAAWFAGTEKCASCVSRDCRQLWLGCGRFVRYTCDTMCA